MTSSCVLISSTNQKNTQNSAATKPWGWGDVWVSTLGVLYRLTDSYVDIHLRCICFLGFFYFILNTISSASHPLPILILRDHVHSLKHSWSISPSPITLKSNPTSHIARTVLTNPTCSGRHTWPIPASPADTVNPIPPALKDTLSLGLAPGPDTHV